jgi:integrase
MRQPKLRKKKVGKHTYWYTEANGGAYFGKVGEVPYKDAKHHFGKHIKQKQAPIEDEVLTVGQLFSSFLGVTGAMLEAWRANMRSEKEDGIEGENDRDKRGLDPQSLLHAETSIRHAFNWASKHNSPDTLLPQNFHPFSGIERTKVPPKTLAEADLLAETEVEALLEAAGIDVDQFRRWGIEKHIKKHGQKEMRPSKDTFADMLRVYHATGARTTELANAKVRDFSPRSRQILLKEHKRSRSENAPAPGTST